MKRLWLLPLLLAAMPSCTAFQTVVGTPSRLSQAASTSFRATRPASVRGLTCTAVKAEGAEDAAFTPTPPPVSVASGLPNKIYMWRGQQVRYQVAGPPDAKQAAVLVHGLFVNADQWRSTLQGLGEAGGAALAGGTVLLEGEAPLLLVHREEGLGALIGPLLDQIPERSGFDHPPPVGRLQRRAARSRSWNFITFPDALVGSSGTISTLRGTL